MEEGEPRAGAKEEHRVRCQDDPIGVQFGALVVVRRTGCDHLTRKACRRHEGDAEQRRRVEQRRFCTDGLLHDAGGHDRNGTDEAGDETEFRVGLDELLFGAHDRRHQCALGDRVGLLRHHRNERQREQQQAVGVEGHQHRQNHTSDGDRLDHESAASCHAVDRWSDEGGHEQEGNEADAQEHQHPAAGRIGVEAEKHRVRESHGHRCVARGDGCVGAGQPTEPRSTGDHAPRRRRLSGATVAHIGIVG